MKLDTSQTCISLKPAEQGFVLLVGAQPSPWQVLSLISGWDVKSLVVVYRAQKVSGKPSQKVKFMELNFFGFPRGKVPGASIHLNRQSCFSGTEYSKGKLLLYFDLI